MRVANIRIVVGVKHLRWEPEAVKLQKVNHKLSLPAWWRPEQVKKYVDAAPKAR